MNVLPLTILLSTLLALLFLAIFLREHRRGASGSAERAALLPLEDERPSPADKRTPLS